MSSRALRKLQREREERQQAEALKEVEDVDSEEGDSPQPRLKALNAFDMLNAANDEDERKQDDEADNTERDGEGNEIVRASGAEEVQQQATKTKKSRKTKKKKNKPKGKGKAAEQLAESGKFQAPEVDRELDEIDLALKSLSAEEKENTNTLTAPTIDDANAQLYRLLAVEAKHLNVLNEMKRLFGNVVAENSEEGSTSQRRRGRGPQIMDLGGALTARNSPISKGQGLKGLALKRNPLIMGKEEWPQATSGGLGMEMVGKLDDGTVEYRFVHSSLYQGVQREFESCVASMVPQRLITMLMFNPYHISTLLQVSEIAKQQGDHSVSGDLLERALFTFGRSVHSSFTHALSEGKARLDFRRPENREFWLAGWRYVKDLGQRGTWRTAYEWAKLILSLDPEGDPYCVSKIIDQLALRGGQSEHFLTLVNLPFFDDYLWEGMPNIHISKAMAQFRLKQPQACRATLSRAVQEYPWIFARLFQELNLSHPPKSIWGKQPRTAREKFDTESYILNAKDIWSLPDGVSLLVEVAETTAPANNLRASDERPITLDEARSTLLTGFAPLIDLLPREITTRPSRSSDPLPPEDDKESYDPSLPTSSPNVDVELEAEYADLPPDREANDADAATAAPQVPSMLASLFSRVMPWMSRVAENDSNVARNVEEADVEPAELIVRNARDQAMAEPINELSEERSRGAERADPAELAQEGQGLQQLLEGEVNLEELIRGGENRPWPPEDSDEERERRLSIPAPVRWDSDSGSENEQQSQDEQVGLKHWLAGVGIQELRSHRDAHPNDTRIWEAPEGEKLITVYAAKLARLKDTRTRGFILRYALPQGTDQGVRRRVERIMGR